MSALGEFLLTKTAGRYANVPATRWTRGRTAAAGAAGGALVGVGGTLAARKLLAKHRKTKAKA